MSDLYRFVEQFNSGAMALVIGPKLGNLSPHCGANNTREVVNDSDEQKGEILALAYFLSSRTFQSDEVKGAVEALKVAVAGDDTAGIQKQIRVIQAQFTEGTIGWAAM